MRYSKSKRSRGSKRRGRGGRRRSKSYGSASVKRQYTRGGIRL